MKTEPQESLILGLGLTTVFGKGEEPCPAGTTQNVYKTRELRDKKKA